MIGTIYKTSWIICRIWRELKTQVWLSLLSIYLPLQPPLEVVNVHSPHRHTPPLSPGAHVVSVDEDVNLDTGGKRKTIAMFFLTSY